TLLVLLCPLSVSAYEVTGGRWFLWKYPNGVQYCPVINASDIGTSTTLRNQFTQAVDDAMLAWTQAGGVATPGISCSDYTVRKGGCTGAPSLGDWQPWVYWEASWDTKVGQ